MAALEQITPIKIREALREAQARVLMNEELARLHRDLNLASAPDALVAPITSSALAQLRKLFTELEFNSLIPRLDKQIRINALKRDTIN